MKHSDCMVTKAGIALALCGVSWTSAKSIGNELSISMKLVSTGEHKVSRSSVLSFGFHPFYFDYCCISHLYKHGCCLISLSLCI